MRPRPMLKNPITITRHTPTMTALLAGIPPPKPSQYSNMSTTATTHSATDVSRRMVCGGLAGMIAKTATNPLERIKILSQTGDASGQTSIVGVYRSILQKEGILGLWAGNGANLLRVFPAKAVVFSSNDVYKQLLRNVFSVSPEQPLPTYLAFLAGGMSGMSASLLTYPLDFARGRISGKLACSRGNKQYRGILHTLSITIKDEGFLAIYKGITPTLLGAMPYEGIKFGTVGIMDVLYPVSEDSNLPLRKMCFGGMGGVMAGLVTYPNDTVRRLLQIQGSRGTNTHFTGYWDCVRKTYAEFGIARFYRGITINLIRMAPNTAIQFYSYELLKQTTADLF